MNDDLALAQLAITVLTKSTEALTGLRERAQRSKDLDIKDGINALYDHNLKLKDVVSRLFDEISALKRQLEQQRNPPEIRQIGASFYYYIGGKGPYCTPCLDEKNKPILLTPPHQKESGAVFRRCLVCNNVFYEQLDRPRDKSDDDDELSYLG